MNGRHEFARERERILEAGEATIAVHEDRIEPLRGPPQHLSLALGFVLQLQDFANRADDERPRPRGVDPFEQRQELEAKRPAAEWKRFEQHGARRRVRIRGKQQFTAPKPIRIVDRLENGIAQRREARVRHANGRQLHGSYATRHAAADRHATADEMYGETVIGQRLCDLPGAHQVPDAQQVLDVDEHAPHQRADWPRAAVNVATRRRGYAGSDARRARRRGR